MASLAEMHVDHLPHSDDENYSFDPDTRSPAKDVLPPSLLSVLLRFDSQAFGVLASFPATFTIATGASALSILITLQITLRTLPVAVTSFLTANITAVLVGRKIGGYFEGWHFNILLDNGIVPSSIGPGSTLPYSSLPQSDIANKSNKNKGAAIGDGKEKRSGGRGGGGGGGGYQSTGTDEEDFANASKPAIIRRRAFRPMKRNLYFQVAFCTVIIIANIFGMMIGSLCAESFPSHLRK